MKNLLKAAQGVIIALVSLALLIGILSLSLAEGMLPTPVPSIPSTTGFPTMSPSPNLKLSTATATLPPAPVVSDTPSPSPTIPILPSLTWTAAPSQVTGYCPPPTGWMSYIVQPNDTLYSIATHYRTNSLSIQMGNCMTDSQVIPGTTIYVPPVATQTSVPCGPPYDWVVYTIQPGDTLYHLSQIYAVSVIDLQRANCMGSSTLLQVGKNFYVPPWPPLVTPVYPPPATLTTMPTFTRTPTPTSSSTIPTETLTLTPGPSDTPTVTPSQTPTPTN